MKKHLKLIVGFGLALSLITSNFTNIKYLQNFGIQNVQAEEIDLAIDYQFYDVKKFSEGRAAVYLESEPYLIDFWNQEYGDKLWGYIDITGELVIENKYTSAGSFSQGYAGVITTSDRAGFINLEGKAGDIVDENALDFIDEDILDFIRPFVFSGYSTFSEGLVAVRREHYIEGYFLWGYMDLEGNLVIDYQFEEAGRFYQGLAAVKDPETQLWGYIDTTGKVVIDFKYDDANMFCEEGLVAVIENGVWKYIDSEGNVKLDEEELNVNGFPYRFVNGSVCVQDNETGLWGYLDTEGNILIDFMFDEARPFNQGLALVYNSEKDAWGYIDEEGNLVIDYQFGDAGSFNESLAYVSNKETGKYGFIDLDGNLVVDYQFDDVQSFNEGLAPVYNAEKGLWGFISALDIENNLKGVEVYLNDEQIDSSKVLSKNGNIFVFLRDVFEKVGASIEWNANTKTIEVNYDGKNIEFVVGSKIITIDGITYELTQVIQIQDGYTIVPIEFLKNILNINIENR